MKLPGLGKFPNLLSLKTKNGWKEIQKNSSVAAKKGQNFILDNIRPLGASKNAKAHWSISAGQKPVNRPISQKNNNIDFSKLVSNVWLSKSSKVSNKNVVTLEEKAADLHGQLDNFSNHAYTLYHEVRNRTSNYNSDDRMRIRAEARELYQEKSNFVRNSKKELQRIISSQDLPSQKDKNQSWNAGESYYRVGRLSASLTSFSNVYNPDSIRQGISFHERFAQKLKSSGSEYDNNMKKLDKIQSKILSLSKKMEEELNNLGK
ncbi:MULTISPECIES: hypothetical protein [Mycetohabitans]|uniref:hypothetical protein n=1 Tax=Mycetohabitans TaxID=2571159 RepID=UPI001F1AA78F|nr:hypothetical protein [Mycetohabitans sp. B3]MCF2134483.1 hypothetical protein [Mycetohabitans sp. B3]